MSIDFFSLDVMAQQVDDPQVRRSLRGMVRSRNVSAAAAVIRFFQKRVTLPNTFVREIWQMPFPPSKYL